MTHAQPTTQRTGGPPVPKRRFHVQWVHIGMQGAGVCIRKISGFVKVTSRSSPTKVRSRIFYVRTSEGHALRYRGFQLPPCPAVLSVSALRAGALALAPTCTRPRTRRGAGPAWRPVRPLSLSWGGQGPAFFAESAGKSLLPWEGGKRAAEGARSKEEAEEGEGSRVRCRRSGEGGSEPDKKPLGRPAARPPDAAEQRPSSSAMLLSPRG